MDTSMFLMLKTVIRIRLVHESTKHQLKVFTEWFAATEEFHAMKGNNHCSHPFMFQRGHRNENVEMFNSDPRFSHNER
ncbi:hypothetical protein V5799_000693 [Amblyomma americanum]|uniref:Uncharacterized protein n=1 Tax=Amblyomma americanum TaxID=6943 RepID=A0AAQ4D2B9_AMBAM